jgi:hypothetical protein
MDEAAALGWRMVAERGTIRLVAEPVDEQPQGKVASETDPFEAVRYGKP